MTFDCNWKIINTFEQILHFDLNLLLDWILIKCIALLFQVPSQLFKCQSKILNAIAVFQCCWTGLETLSALTCISLSANIKIKHNSK